MTQACSVTRGCFSLIYNIFDRGLHRGFSLVITRLIHHPTLVYLRVICLEFSIGFLMRWLFYCGLIRVTYLQGFCAIRLRSTYGDTRETLTPKETWLYNCSYETLCCSLDICLPVGRYRTCARSCWWRYFRRCSSSSIWAFYKNIASRLIQPSDGYK